MLVDRFGQELREISAGVVDNLALLDARDYAGRAGKLAGNALSTTGVQVRRRHGLAVAVGVGIGLSAIATAWLLARRKALTQDEFDEHDPTRYRPTNASGDALDGTGEDNPVPGETGLY